MVRQRRQMSRGSRQLRRKVAVRAPKRTFLVFCEGVRTEPEYVRALKREPAVHQVASVDIRIVNVRDTAPLTLVNAAAEARARQPKDRDDVDEVWCLFDVEWPQNHPNLKQAVDRARQTDIRLAISNPCFELWLVLHFEKRSAWLTTDQSTELRRALDGSSGKGLDGPRYMSRRADARQRARALTAMHDRNETPFPRDNPSSSMFQFLDAIDAGL